MSDVALTMIQKIIEEKATQQAHKEYYADTYGFISKLSVRDIHDAVGSDHGHKLKNLTEASWDSAKKLRDIACSYRINELIRQYSNEVVKNAIASHGKI